MNKIELLTEEKKENEDVTGGNIYLHEDKDFFFIARVDVCKYQLIGLCGRMYFGNPGTIADIRKALKNDSDFELVTDPIVIRKIK